MKPSDFMLIPGLYDRKAHSDKHSVTIPGESMTIQSEADETNLNVLMERFGITGKMPENPRIPEYGDFTGISDYRTAIEAVRRAEDDFMALPAKVRAAFDNNPQLLLLAAHTPGNEKLFKDLGLTKPEVPQPPAPPEPPKVPQAQTPGTT